MSIITLDSIIIKNNPAMFTENMHFEVTFTSLCKIQSSLQWKIIYVGSAASEDYDQVLEEFEIGPFEEPSTMKFDIECSPPDYNKIPYEQLLCVTALIISVSYKQKEFIRVGYYVHNQFINEAEMTVQNYPILPILIAATKRTIISDKPRLTAFNINLDGNNGNSNSLSYITQNHLGKIDMSNFNNEEKNSNQIIDNSYSSLSELNQNSENNSLSKKYKMKEKIKQKKKQKERFSFEGIVQSFNNNKVEEFHNGEIQKQLTEDQQQLKVSNQIN